MQADSATRIYRDEEWEHGLRCGNEDCDHLFVEGDLIHDTFLAMQEETPILMVICERCALGGDDGG